MKSKLIFIAIIAVIAGIWGYNQYSDYQEKKALLESALRQRIVGTNGSPYTPSSNHRTTSRRATSNRQVSCPACDATGYIAGSQCPGCHGTGTVDEATARQIDEMLGSMESSGYISTSSSYNGNNNSYGNSGSRNECVACNPSGDCSHCNGIGVVYYEGQYNTEGGYMKCPVCKGHKKCTTCGGKHYL